MLKYSKYALQKLTTKEKNEALIHVAKSLVKEADKLIEANAVDIKAGEEKGMHSGLLDRLRLTEERIRAMAEGLIQVTELPDPIGEVLESYNRPNGLQIEKRRVPMGVIGIIYESRPNVTCDAFGLCFKTGNCVILKGGSDAICSNKAIVSVLKEALKKHNLPEEACSLIEDTNRETTLAFMKMKDYVDARFTGIICDNYQLCLKTAYVKGGSPEGGDYYPEFNLEDLGDNVGITPSCIWEKWGTGYVGGLGLTDNKGVWLHTPVLSPGQMCTAFDWEFSCFSGEYVVVRHMGLFGLMNRAGELVVDTKYDVLDQLSNPDYFRVAVDGKYGVVDAAGKVIVPLEYSFIGNMREDIIVACKDDLYGCFDKDGNQIVPMEYEEIREYADGMARIRSKGRFGFIDRKGEIIVAPFSDEVENFSDGCALVTIRNKMGFVTLQGDWIAPPMYDAGASFTGGLAPLSMSGKYGYMDKAGNFTIPMRYTDARQFDSRYGLAEVANGSRWGVINTRGKAVIPLEYDKVDVMSDGYICVEKDGKMGIFADNGDCVCPIVLEAVERLEDDRIFKCGVANGMLDGQRVRIDTQGNIVCQYSLL